MHYSDQHIGFIGLGLMGKPMSLNLLRAGYNLHIHNRSQGVVQELAKQGMEPCESIHQLVERSDIVILMLPDTETVQHVVLGKNGVASRVRLRQLIIDMGTTSVAATKEFARCIQAGGGSYIDAPVSGGQIGAEQGNLAIMAGADDQDFARVRPILEVLGENITQVGDVGAGQVAKAANQAIVGLTIGAVAEAIHLARCCGVDPAKMREAFRGGFAWSRIMEVHGQRMIDGSFEPGGKCRTQKKDLDQALELASSVNARMSATELNRTLYLEAIEKGFGELDHSALIEILGPISK